MGMQITLLLIIALAVGVTYSGCMGCMASYQISMMRSGPQKDDPVIVRFCGKVNEKLVTTPGKETKDGTGLLNIGVKKDSKDYFGDATGVIIEKPASQPDGADLKDMVFWDRSRIKEILVWRVGPGDEQKKKLRYRKSDDGKKCKMEKRKIVCGECPDKPLIQTTTRSKPGYNPYGVL